MPSRNVGELFWHVALYFGFYFEYEYEMGEGKEVAMRFNVIDPLNCRNNMGGKAHQSGPDAADVQGSLLLHCCPNY